MERLFKQMANRHRREALRGLEVLVLDYIFQTSTSEQWAEVLKGPLELVAGLGHIHAVQKLVEAGAQVGNALHIAVEGGNGEVVTDLLENGASINALDTTYGKTPLHVAADDGKTEMVKLLMLKGADINVMDQHGRTPLYAAAQSGQVAAALALMAGGADVNIPCGEWRSPLVLIAAESGHVDILRAVINHGADVCAADTFQNTALHASADCNKAEAIDVLIEAGANIEARNSDGWTPLLNASNNASLDALTALCRHGAQVNAQDSYLQTPINRAAAHAGTQGAAEMVDILLRSGADETIVDDEGYRAANVVADNIEDEDRLAEDVERVHKLLANAPADRAWRRRGYLVLCRAHPDRVQQAPEVSTVSAYADNETSGQDVADERASGELADAVEKVLRLQEEGVFRTIVGYL